MGRTGAFRPERRGRCAPFGGNPEAPDLSAGALLAAGLTLAAVNGLEGDVRRQIMGLVESLQLWKLEAERQVAVTHTLCNMLTKCEDGIMRFAAPVSAAEFERCWNLAYDTKTILDFFGEPHREAVILDDGRNAP